MNEKDVGGSQRTGRAVATRGKGPDGAKSAWEASPCQGSGMRQRVLRMGYRRSRRTGRGARREGLRARVPVMSAMDELTGR